MRRFAAVILAAIASLAGEAYGSPECPDAEVLSGRLITDICWDCMFPIYVAGIKMGSGDTPAGAVTDSLCICDDNLGVPHPGFMYSLWEPAKLLELVRYSGCAPTLGGVQLPMSDERLLGGEGNGELGQDNAFYHYHIYAFPLLFMLEMAMEGSCNADGYLDLDLAYISELDPTWNNDELAFFTQPEAAAVANPIAMAACMTDAVSAAIGKPLDSLFWCAGSWGHLYPFSGHEGAYGGMPENTSMLATRAIAAQHRRGLMRRTMGSDAYCYAPIEPMLPKSMYKMTMFFPLAEANDDHVIGENTFQWGEHRTIPGVGEDGVYVLWRWNDCCSTF